MPIQFDQQGREIPDPRPLEVAPGSMRPESLQSMMQRMIRDYVSRQAVDNGQESFEEANDFDVEDEDFDDPLTKYEEMGLELESAGESEEGPATGGNPGSVEPAGLRTAGAGNASGPGEPETGNVDGGAGVNQDPPLPASARKADLGNQPNGAPVLGRGVRP